MVALIMMKQVTIEEILQNPSKFREESIKVVGKVEKPFEVLGVGFFILNDGTGRILILTRHGVPKPGNKIAVIGKVKELFQVGKKEGIVLLEERM